MIRAGVLILLFVAYQLWGTGLPRTGPRTASRASSPSQLAEHRRPPRVAPTPTTVDARRHAAGHRARPISRSPRTATPSDASASPPSASTSSSSRASTCRSSRRARATSPDPAAGPARQRRPRRPPHDLHGAVQPHRRAPARRRDHLRDPAGHVHLRGRRPRAGARRGAVGSLHREAHPGRDPRAGRHQQAHAHGVQPEVQRPGAHRRHRHPRHSPPAPATPLPAVDGRRRRHRPTPRSTPSPGATPPRRGPAIFWTALALLDLVPHLARPPVKLAR